MAWTTSCIWYIVDIRNRKERNDFINTGCNFPYHKHWIDNDSGSINSIGAGQHDMHSMPSYYTGHGIGVRMEKSNGRNNSRGGYGNHYRRYCIQATKPIYVSIKVSVEVDAFIL